jgi:hypothetical protein
MPLTSQTNHLDISIVRGEVFSYQLNFNRDISGYSFLATVANNMRDGSGVPFTIVVDDAAAGKMTFSLTIEQTTALMSKIYKWYLKATETIPNTTEKILMGDFVVYDTPTIDEIEFRTLSWDGLVWKPVKHKHHGDMYQFTYDTDGDGVVDNAERLGGHTADEFALAGEGGPGGVGFNDAEGDPLAVDADPAVDGTSVYAARRDHKHGLGTHTHDDRYFTETETNTLLSGKSDTTHNHDANYASLSHAHASQALLMAGGTNGLLSVGVDPYKVYNVTGQNKTISRVFLAVATAPTGASIIVDVLKNGVTIFTNTTNRPAILAGEMIGQTTTIDVSSWANNEYLTISVVQIGSVIPGAYLTVHVVYA